MGMVVLMKNYKWGSFLLVFIILGFFVPLLGPIPILSEKETPFYSEQPLFSLPKFSQECVETWKEMNINADQNQNGLNDRLEQKLNFLGNLGEIDGKINTGKQLNPANEELENISIVVQFPKGDINSIFPLFKNYGGEIKVIYDTALNGFAGSINYQGLRAFYNILMGDHIPFLIEEDSCFNMSLYYATRNMNLRPYVWNSLGFTGDQSGSIALIDTGIDDSHTFFTPGYSEGNASYKIIGWKDILNNLSYPYDDNGHGSHCAGIAAGNGSSTLDGSGRMVATYAYVYDQKGIFVSGQIINVTAARFNVTNPGTVELNCQAYSSVQGSGSVYVKAYLYHNETIMDSYVLEVSSWNHTIAFNATIPTLGEYSLRLAIVLKGFLVAGPYAQFRTEIYWPFNPPSMDSGNLWRGVASATHLVGVKAMNAYGSGILSNIIAGIDWVIANKRTYNISVLSLSFSGDTGQSSIISAVNNAVENGIVVVVAAGNNGGLSNTIGSPGDADSVITVAAMNSADNVTEYSSPGGPSFTGNTVKPDIMAPGGSHYYFSIFSTDTNDNDGFGVYSTDAFLNDLSPMVGTSMAVPAVAGAANLLIEAMGGSSNWNYSAIEAKEVKALLLMAASETYPLQREIYANNSPTLERGGKDSHEGYGRLNIDAALEAYLNELNVSSSKSAWLSSSYTNPMSKHALGCHVNLLSGQNYSFKLTMPWNADFDLYLYNNSPSSIGEPQLLASSISNESGKTELVRYTPLTSGKYYLIAKAISSEGWANISNVENKFAPLLVNGSVSPQTGDQSILYNFSVLYMDLDDFAPTSVDLLVNGTLYQMSKLNAADENYTDGAIFQYLTFLQPGTYNHSFRCSDGKYTVTNASSTLLIVYRTNSQNPYLIEPRVSPEIGGNITLFDFKVNYFDADNNFPSFINVTINVTSYIMVQVNPFDGNAMDGVEYHFKTALEIGYYQFQITCSDGTYSNTTYWINAPEVTPFFELIEELIVINEVFTAHPSYIELYNYGTDKNMTDWTLQLYYNNVLINTFEFPTGWIFYKQTVVVLHEKWGGTTGTNNATDLFTEWGIPWDSGQIAVGVFNNLGYHQDWFQTSAFTGLRPNDVKWTQNSPITLDSDCAYRIDDEDTHNASDWLVEEVGTPGNLNSGQTGVRKNSLFAQLLTPPNNSALFSGLIEFKWESLELPLNPINYTFQISNMSNFSNIAQEVRDIHETTNISSQQITINLPSGQYFWRVCPVYGAFNGFWSDYSTLSITSNEYVPKLINGAVTPRNGTQYTLFNFSVIYMDSDNNPPLSVNISINENTYSLEKLNSSDLTYDDGCIFGILTYLNPGLYNYSFMCDDGKFTNETTHFFDLNVTEINLVAPILSNGQVSPNIGYEATTLFIFSINYTDMDNNVPIFVNVVINSTSYAMIQRDPLDRNYRDGCIFIFSTYLRRGTNFYFYNCSDDTYSDNIGPYTTLVEYSVNWNSVSLQDVRIGGIITHGEDNPRTKHMFYPYVTYLVMLRGANITDITGLLTLDLLSNYDMLWLDQRGEDMAESEIDAVEEWIQEGGRLLVCGEYFGSAVNLLQRFNITFEPGTTGIYTNETYFHPITNNVHELRLNDPKLSLNISAQPNAKICVELNNSIIVAAMEFGKGRIVIICEEYIFFDATNYDNYIFINNTFGWLGYKSNYAPHLLNPTRIPETGNTLTQFNFSILYQDLDNNVPLYINIVLNGTPYTMEKQNPFDGNYSDGCLYQFIIQLAPGTYFYSFECSDIVFYNSTLSFQVKIDPIPSAPPFPWTGFLFIVSLAVVAVVVINRIGNKPDENSLTGNKPSRKISTKSIS